MIKNLLLIGSILLLLTSCAFKEEVHIKNDGSGSYEFTIDMSPMMEAMKEGGFKQDSLKKPQLVDTTFVFKDILEDKKDSIAQLSIKDQASLKAIEDMKLHVKIDEAEGKGLMSFGLDFDNISEVKNIEEKLFKGMAVNKKQSDGPSLNKSNVTFSFDGDNFTRKTILKNLSEEEEEEVDKSIEQSGSFLEGSMYTLIYHFESKIKTVSHKEALISKDGKTVIIEVPMDSIIKYPKYLDFDLKLK